MERVVRALLLTDVVDSTKLVESLGEERAAEVWAAHDTAARELLPEHRGREIDKTDGFLLLFESSADAAAYALAYHRALAALSTELGVALQARAGVHLDRVILRKNPAADVALGAKPLEVEGLAKPMAARVMSLARGGQTLLTGAARGDMRDAQPEGSQLEFHGHWRLKGVTDPVALFELGMPGEAPFAPPPDAEKAYRVVDVGERWEPAREIPHALPVERDAFVGREPELAELARRLDGDGRLVTVLGTGGTGKTRMTIRYARTWMGDYSGGAWFCDLAGARSVDGIAHAVATALDVPLGKDPLTQLGHAIAGRGRCLVILDNFEQVARHAGETLGRWLERAPDVSFVVTSRERLQLAGEEVMNLEPLPIDGAAVELFVQRARAQKKDFALTDDNRVAVGEVVRLLDGLPLAIELAAARTRLLSPTQLVERMKDRFELLAGKRGATERQATLRAAIDWSWDLLEPWEQAAMAQASVFEGGFTLEAAEEVLELSAWPDAPWPLDAVQALVDKSLLRTWAPKDGGNRHDIDEPYFGMYVSIHEYASEKLRTEGTITAESGQGWSGPAAERSAQERHGEYFAGFGSDDALEALEIHGGVARCLALALELENLVAACRRALGREDGATAVGAYRAAWAVLALSGPNSSACALALEVLALDCLAPRDRVRMLLAAGRAVHRGGRPEEALGLLEEALAIARQQDDVRLEGRAENMLGIIHFEQGRPEQARVAWGRSLQVARDLGHERAEAGVLGSLANLQIEQGDREQAREQQERALTIIREVGDRAYEAKLLAAMGVPLLEVGRLEEARELWGRALVIHREVGDRASAGGVLCNIGLALMMDGHRAEALTHYEEALKINREVGNQRFEGVCLSNLGLLHQEEGRFDDAILVMQQSLAIARQVGNRRVAGHALGNIGNLHSELGRYDEADLVFEESEALMREVDARPLLLTLLCQRGRHAVRKGDREGGRSYLAQAEAIGDGLAVDAGADHESIALLRGDLARTSEGTEA